jgi:hypothetical protein
MSHHEYPPPLPPNFFEFKLKKNENLISFKFFFFLILLHFFSFFNFCDVRQKGVRLYPYMGNGGVYLYMGAPRLFGVPKTDHTLLLTGGSVLVQSKGMKTIYINSIETMEGQIFK